MATVLVDDLTKQDVAELTDLADLVEATHVKLSEMKDLAVDSDKTIKEDLADLAEATRAKINKSYTKPDGRFLTLEICVYMSEHGKGVLELYTINELKRLVYTNCRGDVTQSTTHMTPTELKRIIWDRVVSRTSRMVLDTLDLSRMTADQLKDMCKEHGIRFRAVKKNSKSHLYDVITRSVWWDKQCKGCKLVEVPVVKYIKRQRTSLQKALDKARHGVITPVMDQIVSKKTVEVIV